MTTAVLFALAAALVVGAPAEKQLRRLQPVMIAQHRAVWVLPTVLGCAGLVLTWMVMGLHALVWLVTGGVVAGTVSWLMLGARGDRRRARMRSETARAAKTLALLLQAGQIPALALNDAATDCPALAPVALTGLLGGDVAAVFEGLGAQPGGEGYARVSAAWHVSERTGAPIALVLARVAENLRRERHLAGVVAAELAAARASGRIMALLPFVAIALGSLVGANPLAFLFGSLPGQLALLAGTTLACVGVVWTERIARTGEPSGATRR